MSQLSQIKTFVKVAELRSLAATARELHVSAAAISKQITKLEAELGVQLLLRTTRTVELTELGSAYLEQCRRILEEVDAADTLITQMKVVPYGQLKVLSQPHFTERYITPNVGEFLTLYPDIELQLEIGERITDLEFDRVDVMLGQSVSLREDAIQRRIASTRYTICASPEYLKKFGIPGKPEALSYHRCIAHSGRRPMNHFYFHDQPDLPFKPYMSANDTKVLSQLAKGGVGVVQLHDYVVRDAIERGELVSFLDEVSRRDVSINVALPPRRFTPSKVRCFIDFIVNKVKTEAAPHPKPGAE
jgi:DNA-binding transcriptional LysR family regulator